MGESFLIFGLFNLKKPSRVKKLMPEIGIEPIRGFGPTGF